MCLAIPMEIRKIREFSAELSVAGTSTNADISLIENPAIGDYVIVHAGFAIEKIDKTEAEKRIRLFDEIGITENALPSS